MRKRNRWTKPEADRKPIARECMTCGADFPSFGPGNRRCNECRNPRDYEPYGQRAAPGVQVRDDVCRAVLKMKPRRRPQYWGDSWI